VTRVAAASSAEFEALVAHHRREVFALCRSVLHDEHLGADAAQEAFVRLWKRMDSNGTPQEPRGWLRKAAISSAIDQLRRKPRTSPLEELGDPQSPLARESADPAQLTETELRTRFESALAALPEGQRTIFLLRHEGGLSLVDIARTLGLSRETVRTQFARAALKLQYKLSAFRPERDES
jgi:RNA polymerase sigma-70 factor (ECF subfamily)